MKTAGIVLGLSLALGIAAAQPPAQTDQPKTEKKVVEKKGAEKKGTEKDAKSKKDPKANKQTKGKAGEPKAQ